MFLDFTTFTNTHTKKGSLAYMPVIPVIGKLKQKIATKEIEDCKFQASSLFLKKKVMLMIPPNYKPKRFCIDPAIHQ